MPLAPKTLKLTLQYVVDKRVFRKYLKEIELLLSSKRVFYKSIIGADFMCQ